MLIKKTFKKDKIAAIILAAGKGVRMGSKKINKVMLPLGGRPMIAYTLDLFKKLNIKKIVVVVGFAQDSVKKFLGSEYIYVEQKRQLGTAHAVGCALEKIPSIFGETLVLNGDDSAFYQPEIIKKLIDKHREENAALTLLTLMTERPHGLGRVLRSKRGEIDGIIEEKDASEKQRKINEVNPGCYLFRRSFLEKYLPKVKKSPFSGEYYLTDLVKLGTQNKDKIESLQVKNLLWRGINTRDELREAEKMMGASANGN